MSKVLLRMEKISKHFPGVKALDQVDLNVYEGKVMALLGENGAGKSTLMKILSGVYQKTEGELFFKGKPLKIDGPKDAMMQGIAIIHQELNLLEELSIAENIFMGRFPSKAGIIQWKKLYSEASALMARLNLNFDVKMPVKALSIGQKQMVEIAKALSFETELIIMDEPTDALTDQETESLFAVIRGLVASGKSIVYISHRLKEIFEICDDVTVLRDGQFIAEKPVSEIDENLLIELMVGRRLEEQYPYIDCKTNERVFKVEALSNRFVRNIQFELFKGEILGVAGLMGAGRTELAKSIYGHLKCDEKRMRLNDEAIHVTSEKEGLKKGIAYVSEDRKKDGLVLGMSVCNNVTLSSLEKYSRMGIIDKKAEKSEVESYQKSMSIKTPTIKQPVKLLSGGNQQKVSIAKSLSAKPKVLILDEPTRGVDVCAKKEIYELMNAFKKEGLGILMISSEIPELLGVCDRIMVMKQGEISGILTRSEATQEKIMRLAIGTGEQ